MEFLQVHSIRTLQETSKLTNDKRVAREILSSFYVEDFLSGCNSIEEAADLQDGLIQTLAPIICICYARRIINSVSGQYMIFKTNNDKL